MYSKIRVGIIRCDLHGVYYGVSMDEHDPLELRELNNSAFFYHYTQYNDPKKKTTPSVPGFEIVKVWDEDRELAERMSSIFNSRPEVCKSFEDVSDDVDLVFIANCNGDGSDHLKFAVPGIEKGIATFIDKPFACKLEDAMTIVEMSEKHKVPVMSLSILREIPPFTLFKKRFIEVGEPPEYGIIKGGGTALAGQIHAISLAQHLFGTGVESVSCMGRNPLAYIHLDYGCKKGKPVNGVMLNTDVGSTYHCAFYASVYGRLGAVHSPGIGDFEFPYGVEVILKKIKKMVETRVTQVPYEEMIENIAVVEAAREAQKTGKATNIGNILNSNH